jgi:hypothetical protein
MQLDNKRSIRNALAIATCGVLSQSPLLLQAEELSWKSDITTLHYSEKGRVSVSESIISFRREVGEDEWVSLKFSWDAITGASANGAIFNPPQSGSVQTVTSPSGSTRTFQIGGSETVDPLTKFKDVRVAAQVTNGQSLTPTLKGEVVGNLSFENDYDSYGVGGSFSRDIFQRMITLAGGISLDIDTVRPLNGNPQALVSISDPTRLGEGEKQTIQSIIGFSQVVSRNTLTQFNYSRTMQDGYLTDPYKIITIVKPDTGAPVDYLYEKRPTSRVRNSIFWNTAHYFTEDVAHLSYRYYWDDWGVQSHTADLKYRMDLPRGHSLSGTIRYYTQMSADFYQYSLNEGAPLPSFASADYRLGHLTTKSAAFKYSIPINKQIAFSLRAEKMDQRDVDNRFPSIGAVLFQATVSISDQVDYALSSRAPP